MRRREMLVVLASLALSPRVWAAALADELAEASRGGRYSRAGGAELAAAEGLFDTILAGAPDTHIALRATQLGMDWRDLGKQLRVLREAGKQRRGRGLYAFRRERPLRRVLQVPHSFKDLRTREIGLVLLAEGGFDAAAWNTVPRRQERDGRHEDSDLAHLAASWFNAFTRALARAPGARVVLQLHGFDAGLRDSAPAAVISNGTRRPDPALRRLAGCLERALGRQVGLYPDQVAMLGGTRNAQAALLAGRPGKSFVHLEMDRDLREALLRERALRDRLSGCVAVPA